jgi:glycosyltransferase involved in cell wall biosynthesis
MRQAGGIKNKLLEALAMGLAVVATPGAAEGLDLCAGEQALLASDAHGLAEACLRLLSDDVLAQKLGAAARAWAVQHTWDRTAQAYLTEYDRVMEIPR